MDEHSGLLQCPCCDYYTLPAQGEFEICPICFWEDDGQDVQNLEDISGPNHITLQEARQNFQAFGACDRSMLRNVIPVEMRAKYRYESRLL